MIYGLPLEKKFPLNTPEEIIKAINDFNTCHKIKRRILADNINQQLCKHDMLVKVPESSDFINYIDDRYKAGVISESRFSRTCKGICDIEYDGKINEYNMKVFNRMVEISKDIKDVNERSVFLSDANEYADKIMKHYNVLPKEFVMSMEIVESICKSLFTSILGFSPSEAYVDKLLEDLEEFHILYSTSVWYMKRHLLYLNHTATNIGLKNNINKKIADKTNQLLRNETSIYNQMKLSKGRLNAIKDCDNSYFVSYLKDKQMELKAYLNNQYNYFLSGDATTFHGGDNGMSESDEMIFLNCVSSSNGPLTTSNCITLFLKRYPKLSTNLSNSVYFLLRTKYKKVKRISDNNGILTLVLLNKEPYLVCKKKHTMERVLYLIRCTDIEQIAIVGENDEKPNIKAIKVKFNKRVYDDPIEKSLECATKF